MYNIIKDGAVISTEDNAVYVRLQENGVYIICPESEAQGIVVNGSDIYALSGGGLPGAEEVTVEEFSGAAELAEARGELELLLSDARSGLNQIPTQGAAWNAETRYTAGDTVEGGYVALRYSRNKSPADYLGTYWAHDEDETIAWESIEDGTVIYEGGVVSYGGKAWRCTAQHFKSSVYKPKENSSKWEEIES